MGHVHHTEEGGILLVYITVTGVDNLQETQRVSQAHSSDFKEIVLELWA